VLETCRTVTQDDLGHDVFKESALPLISLAFQVVIEVFAGEARTAHDNRADALVYTATLFCEVRDQRLNDLVEEFGLLLCVLLSGHCATRLRDRFLNARLKQGLGLSDDENIS